MFLTETLSGRIFVTLLVAMTPVLELRGALPLALSMGLSPAAAFGISVIGNMIPVPFIILLIRRIFNWLRKLPWWEPKIRWLEERGHLKGRLVHKYRLPGLLILVAIPLPGTGAWTGSLVAALLDIRLKSAVPTIFLGVVIAGLITLGVSCGVISLWA